MHNARKRAGAAGIAFALTGMGSRRYAHKLPDGLVLRCAAALFCAMDAIAALIDAGLPARNSAIALGLGVGSCVFLLRSRIESKLLARLGAFSFSIFLFHSVFSAASRTVLMRLFGPRCRSSWSSAR